mmetsp:Transcript_31989/g.59536  ORF Transcript_31989/g.59536 Transcript_31989/m.59536 type:complete len:90 (+) Transcript_31989:332-601(+)
MKKKKNQQQRQHQHQKRLQNPNQNHPPHPDVAVLALVICHLYTYIIAPLLSSSPPLRCSLQPEIVSTPAAPSARLYRPAAPATTCTNAS